MAQNLETFVALGIRNPEKTKGSQLSYIHFPTPDSMLFKTATCGLHLVQADNKYHFIMSSTFLPSSPLYFPVPMKASTEITVTACAVQYSTAEYTVQQTDVTYVGRLYVDYSKWALHSTTVRWSQGLGRGPPGAAFLNSCLVPEMRKLPKSPDSPAFHTEKVSKPKRSRSEFQVCPHTPALHSPKLEVFKVLITPGAGSGLF